MPNGRCFCFLGRTEDLALKAVELMRGCEEAESTPVADNDAGRTLAGFDDVGVVHKGSCRRHRPTSLIQGLSERDDQRCECQHTPVAADARRQEKWSEGELPLDKKRSFIATTPWTKEPTNSLRGALAIGDAVQAAPSNSRGRAP